MAFFYQIKLINDKGLPMKASILAIGSELTSGQIINKNAAAISSKLKALGVHTAAHLTVPDDRAAILEALNFLNGKSDLLFVTGGLGPTSDDFTREVVSEWVQKPLKFDDQSWTNIHERLTSRGFAVKDMQKQQCYYPEGAKILWNSEGTANGFQLSKGSLDIFVLPGPPREIEAVWRDHINAFLLDKTKEIVKVVTRSWDTIGFGESDVAFQVEELLHNRPRNSFFEIGYRVHLPYVEVKVSYHSTEEQTWAFWVAKVEQLLAPMTVCRDFTDVAEQVLKKLKDYDFTFYDYVSGGFMHARLSPFLKNMPSWSFKQSDTVLSVDLFENEDNFSALLPFEDDKVIFIYSVDGNRKQLTIEAPMKAKLMSERRKQYFTEIALSELAKPV
ncbi:MAG: nucleotide-utilizing enzyme [Pseudobdellovibrio sp.]|jgi:molybdenum cofactor synthesis domain-containing protein|nr:nucleotide-utilizing enzyme [Pseudobdellovibrio sp.]